jgi:hypothetical protein
LVVLDELGHLRWSELKQVAYLSQLELDRGRGVAAIGEVGQREDRKGRPVVGEMEQGEKTGMRS